MKTKFDPRKHHRRSIRLKGYDYSQPGAYFITICTWQRECIFGEVQAGKMKSNRFGEIVHSTWRDLPQHYPNAGLGAFCLMPNHLHGIIVLDDETGAKADKYNSAISIPADYARSHLNQTHPNKSHGLPEIIRALKSFAARRVNLLRKTPGVAVWQRNYYERIIRDQEEYLRISAYILNNPLNWEEDENNPMKPGI